MFFKQEALDSWLSALRAGQVVAAPAEGVYGYCADPLNETALQNLLHLKQRDPQKGLIVLIGNLAQAQQVMSATSAALAPVQHAMATHWKAGNPPTTLIVPAHNALPHTLTGGRATIAVRLPHCPYMLEYLNAFGGPLVSTSLNVSGQPPAIQANQIPAGVPALTVAETLSGTPSRIFNPLENQWLR